MRERRGFTLVETLIALTLLGVAASVMVAPLYTYARDVNGVSHAQARNGVLSREVNRLMVLPFDSLDRTVGCVVRSTEPLPHTRCVTVTLVSATRKRVAVVIAPAVVTVRPDTVTFERAQGTAGNPFDLP